MSSTVVRASIPLQQIDVLVCPAMIGATSTLRSAFMICHAFAESVSSSPTAYPSRDAASTSTGGSMSMLFLVTSVLCPSIPDGLTDEATPALALSRHLAAVEYALQKPLIVDP